MEISTVKSPVNTAPYSGDKSAAAGQAVNPKPASAEQKTGMTDETSKQTFERPVLQETVDKMNKAMQDLLNTGIQFQLYEKTDTLMVQVVDTRDKRVIKEFPPHEFLDTMAKIREYIGILLDRHI